jgi:predicted ribosomally synthesized peptide with nif11-like leader
LVYISLEMSEEQLTAFLEAVKADPGLQEKLSSAASPADIEAIAMHAGYVISADEFARAKVEIPDHELEEVAGGRQRQDKTDCYSGTQIGNATCYQC